MKKKRNPRFKWLRKSLQLLLILFLVVVLYVIIVLVHGTMTDYQPEAEITVTIEQKTERTTIPDSNHLHIFNWNIGYAGLGKESDFFFDDGGMFFSGGKMVRSNKALVEKNMAHIDSLISSYKDRMDFFLLQEVDKDSKRSYFINQYEQLQNSLKNYASSFAPNYKAARVPIPIAEPWNAMGKVLSGLATFGKYDPQQVTRYQFPGKYGWPTRIFQLDRCMAVHRYKVSNGKELLLINSHNSAYDGGKLKKEEMAFLQEFVQKEYQKGNYVVVGADWNQCPPNFRADQLPNSSPEYYPGNISPEFLPLDWVWAADYTTATNRSNANPYTRNETAVTLIDFYLMSPNVRLHKVKGINIGFESSDHQPVIMEISLER